MTFSISKAVKDFQEVIYFGNTVSTASEASNV